MKNTEQLEKFLIDTFEGGYDEMSYSLRQKYGKNGDNPAERILHFIQKNYIEREGIEITLKPKTDPSFSCPQSVLHLPTVVEGIKKGEIIIVLNS